MTDIDYRSYDGKKGKYRISITLEVFGFLCQEEAECLTRSDSSRPRAPVPSAAVRSGINALGVRGKMNLRYKAAETFERACFWAGERGWHQVNVDDFWYKSKKSPGTQAAACRVLFEVSAWAMRMCMGKHK